MKQIIDIARKGNVVRLYLGEKTEKWGWTNPNYKDYTGKTPEWLEPTYTFYGDDWDDTPYEHNAGLVYDYFIKGTKDLFFPFNTVLLMPEDGILNSEYCKDDFVDRKVPYLIAISDAAISLLEMHSWEADSYSFVWNAIRKYMKANKGKLPDGVTLYYLGDAVDCEKNVLFDNDNYRVAPISRFNIKNETFETLPIKEGVSVEQLCGHTREGTPYYYVLTFVKWDDDRIVYDALLDRIADAWSENPKDGTKFKSALEYAERLVTEANKKE